MGNPHELNFKKCLGFALFLNLFFPQIDQVLIGLEVCFLPPQTSGKKSYEICGGKFCVTCPGLGFSGP